MCVPSTAPTDSPQWFVHHQPLQDFVAHVHAMQRVHAKPEDILAAIRPGFEALVADQTWLPAEFQHPAAASGMGGGIGMWLLYRAADGGLALSSLVVPAGSITPVHDHLTWGLVGVYRGRQEETIYRRLDQGQRAGYAALEVQAQLQLQPGDCYDLLSHNDIHQVRTISAQTSVSLHLLGNDNGCTWRHQFHPEELQVSDFRSGWLNAECREYPG